ncbi:efflux RND transporter periplasmic adaptor subunit [Flavobacteriaceae bacterium]|jgi:RND family efflux transporter MFP subunit|nr:efflux RND transporter periplasmic adaptor subunit [Flavobacteriaceae bacterium]MDC1372390.1 efflux RND transporter periplasmic adaptor subunit [Flavobacteriaceae bacterium]
MKNLYFLFIVLTISCSNNESTFEEVLKSTNIELLKEKRDQLTNIQQKTYEKINLIDSRLKAISNESKDPIVYVKKLEESTFKHYVELQGDVKSNKIVSIFPEFSGIVKEIKVKSGDNVIKGQKLAIIDDGGLKQQLAQLKITFELVKTTYERQKRLWEQKIGSEIQYLETKSIYEAQKQSIDQINKQLEKTVIKAPFDGVIDNVIVKEGEVIYPGRSNLMLLVNLDNMYVESKVPEKYLNTVTENKDVIMYFPMLDLNLESSIKYSANFINPSNRTFRIEADIPTNIYNIKPNLNAKIKVNDYTNENAITVKLNHINIDSENNKYVYKIVNKENTNYAVKTAIETGLKNGDFIEVTKGLLKNDIIVTEGFRNLTNNSTVKIINK